jgi:hypothetical protein
MFFYEYGLDDYTMVLTQEVETLFAHALVNPMAARCAAKAAKKSKAKKADILEDSGVVVSSLALAKKPAPPYTAKCQIGNFSTGKGLLRSALATAEQVLLSALDGNLQPLAHAVP